MKVWVCESGDYEQRGIDGVWDSLEHGIAGVKADYGAPYVVEWVTKKETLVGHFARVNGYSIEHICSFYFTEMEVRGGEADDTHA